MLKISVARAKAGLSGLLKRAQAGEEVVIVRHGKPVARLTAISTPKLPIPSLAQFRKKMPPWRKPSAKLLREARDESL
jgi:prevent-host-death family protein